MDAHPQAIIVAPECNHEGNARLEEYSPYDFVWQEYGIKGRGKAYLDWMVQELKPLIDAKYPTLPDREHTAIGGSSMGGLMSLYGVTAHNEAFSRAACLSPSVRFSFTEVKADIKKQSWLPARGSISAGASARAMAATRWRSTPARRWRSRTC